MGYLHAIINHTFIEGMLAVNRTSVEYGITIHSDTGTGATFAAADSCYIVEIRCGYCSTIYGDIGTGMPFSTTNSCSSTTSGRRYHSAAYGDV